MSDLFRYHQRPKPVAGLEGDASLYLSGYLSDPFDSKGRSRMSIAQRNNYYGRHEPFCYNPTQPPSSVVNESTLDDLANAYRVMAAALSGRSIPKLPEPEPEPVTERGGFGSSAVQFGMVKAKPETKPNRKTKRAKRRRRAQAKSRHRIRK